MPCYHDPCYDGVLHIDCLYMDLLQGTLDMLVLRTLVLGPLHGYGIAKAIRNTSKEALDIEFGSLYPAWDDPEMDQGMPNEHQPQHDERETHKNMFHRSTSFF